MVDRAQPRPAGPGLGGALASRRDRRAAGATLIEVLLVMGVVVLLLAPLTPALSRSRQRAARIKTLSNIGQSARVIATYAGDWRERIPWLPSPGGTRWYLRLADGRVQELWSYWQQSEDWTWALADAYYDGNPTPASAHASWGDRSVGSGFAYSCAFVAHPD